MEDNKQKQIFIEMDRHLLDPQPSLYFNSIKDQRDLARFPFSMLTDLIHVPQSLQFHPEGNVWNHTMLVIDEAAKLKNKSSNERVFLWAALLHDVGKKDTTKQRNGRITAYDHDKRGEMLAEQFLREFSVDEPFITGVSALVKWHMQILFVVKSLKFADISSMNKEVDIREVALLGFCDRMGRLGVNQRKEEENIRMFLDKCGLPPIKF